MQVEVFNVSDEGSTLRKAPGAVRAHIGLLSGMHSHVLIVVILPMEGLVTAGAEMALELLLFRKLRRGRLTTQFRGEIDNWDGLRLSGESVAVQR